MHPPAHSPPASSYEFSLLKDDVRLILHKVVLELFFDHACDVVHLLLCLGQREGPQDVISFIPHGVD